MTPQPRRPRPWYVTDRACDEYRTTLADDGSRLPMLKTLKIVRSIIVNLGLIVVALQAVGNGAEPTIIGALVILVIGAYNGLEFSDYMALVQAYQEVQDEGNDE
jgi:hypothetical protein